MKEYYVSYEQAVKLQELGFDWECLHFYPYNCLAIKKNCSHGNFNSFEMRFNGKYGAIYSAPRIDQAQAWLREVKEIIVWTSPEFYEGDVLEDVRWYFYAQPLYNLRKQLGGKVDCKYYPTYELALSAGITEALKLLEERK